DCVHALNEGDFGEDAGTFSVNLFEQDPGDGSWIRSAAGAENTTRFDDAAALAFPFWTSVVRSDLTVVAFLGEQTSLRRNEVPCLCDHVPSVDLHALRVSVKRELVSFLDLDAGTLRRQLRTIFVVECEGGCD